MSEHLDSATLRAFLAGDLEAPETRKVASHLLGRCELCQSLAQHLWYERKPSSAAPSPSSGAESDDSPVNWKRLAATLASQQASIAAEAGEAKLLTDRLLAHPLGQRLMMIRNVEAFCTWSVVEQLIEEAWDARFDDAALLVELSETALAVADNLDENRYGIVVHDLRARVWSHLANGHGILHEFPPAERCMKEADRELALGTGDPLELATSLKLRVGLRIREKRYHEATTLCERQMAIYERLGDRQSLGEATNQLGTVRAHEGRVQEAIELLRESCELLDPAIDPRFLASSRHNLLAMLHENGELEEALNILRELRADYEEFGDRRSLLELRYTEGEIAASIGQIMAAERCFLEVRNGFVALGHPVQAAEATLELSLIYLKDGRLAETRRLAEQMVPIFQCKGLEQEALAALLIFRDAAVKETVTTHLANETLKLVQRMQAGA